MKIANNAVVAVHYTLVVDGQVADKSSPERPLDFIFGKGMLLPKFEENLLGKEPGDKVEFTLTPQEGYGEYDPQAVVEIPISVFEVEGVNKDELLVVGNMIPMMNQMGGVMPGKVLEVKPEVVVMDFNSQMAGKTLNFSVEVVSVREATEKELSEGLHGEFANHGCSCGSCGCGCDDGNCGEGGCCSEGGCC